MINSGTKQRPRHFKLGQFAGDQFSTRGQSGSPVSQRIGFRFALDELEQRTRVEVDQRDRSASLSATTSSDKLAVPGARSSMTSGIPVSAGAETAPEAII